MDRVGVTGVRLDAFASNKMPDLLTLEFCLNSLMVEPLIAFDCLSCLHWWQLVDKAHPKALRHWSADGRASAASSRDQPEPRSHTCMFPTHSPLRRSGRYTAQTHRGRGNCSLFACLQS